MVKYYCDRCKEEISKFDLINRRLFKSFYEVSFYDHTTETPSKIINIPELPNTGICLCNKCLNVLDETIRQFLKGEAK